MNKGLRFFFSLLLFYYVVCSGQTGLNHIVTSVPLQASSSEPLVYDDASCRVSVTCYDDLGREISQVTRAVTPDGSHLATAVKYDSRGRQCRAY